MIRIIIFFIRSPYQDIRNKVKSYSYKQEQSHVILA